MGPVPAILLAAGASRRLGRPKQLVALGGETLLGRTARLALSVCEPVLVVVGHQEAAMREALEGLPVRIVVNARWETGMASSLQAGLEALPPCTGALFLVSDQPRLERPVLAAVLEAHRADPGAIVACRYGGVAGIPALLPVGCFPALAALEGDQGARTLLRAPGVLEIPFPGGEMDVDLPRDLEALGP